MLTSYNVLTCIGLPFSYISEMVHSSLNEHSNKWKSRVRQSLMTVDDSPLLKEGAGDSKPLLSALNGERPSISQEPRFRVCSDDEVGKLEMDHSLLMFLNCKDCKTSFKNLYDLSFSFLGTLFYGYKNEEQLVEYFGLAREAAKRAHLPWALTRLCYLLGRMCIRKLKFSQARVYFEEALAAVQGDFSDLCLIVSLYTYLTCIYMKQKNKEKCMSILDKAASLLMGLPDYVSSTVMVADILKYALKRAVLSRSKTVEARACFLLATHYLNFRQGEEALPFLERLQLLNNELGLQNSPRSMDCYFQLGQLYSQKCLPHLVLSCVKIATSCSSCTLLDSLRGIDLVLKNAPKLRGLKMAGQTLPSHIVYYLKQMLHLLEASKDHQELCRIVCCNLARLYSQHKQYGKAVCYMEKVLDINTYASIEGKISHFVFLSWLYILHQQNMVALDILNAIVESSQSSRQQLGVTYNMIGVGLKRMNQIKQAAENYYKALSISREAGLRRNQAVALANFGILCLDSAGKGLGEHFLMEAVKLFSELPSAECGRDFIAVLLRLGNYYISGMYKDKGRCCYEWAFLVAMETSHLEGKCIFNLSKLGKS